MVQPLASRTKARIQREESRVKPERPKKLSFPHLQQTAIQFAKPQSHLRCETIVFTRTQKDRCRLPGGKRLPQGHEPENRRNVERCLTDNLQNRKMGHWLTPKKRVIGDLYRGIKSETQRNPRQVPVDPDTVIPAENQSEN